MQYKCTSCGETHEGAPSLAASAPLYFYSIPETERGKRCQIDTDTCTVDDSFFFVRGCLEVPIIGESDPFVWGIWVSLSKQNFDRFKKLFAEEYRSDEEPFFGWLSAALLGYPTTENLKTLVHLRDFGVRPFVELEPTDHPLAVEQRAGITADRAAEILSLYYHH